MEALRELRSRRGRTRSSIVGRPWSAPSLENSFTRYDPTCRINRYYDSATDSFISVDPAVQQTAEPYAFVNDNPLNAIDPLGLYFSSGTGQSAFVFKKTSKRSGAVDTTIFVTSGSLPLSATVTSSPVTVPISLGFTATISATATVTGPQNKSLPKLNVASDGSVGVTSNGVTTSVAGSGGNTYTSLSASVSGASNTLNVGGDKITASIDVTLNYTGYGTSGTGTNLARSAAVATGGGLLIWWLGKLASPACGPFVVACAAGL